ncbi:MAG: molybdenum cofactor guanylyltransferase [Gaiellales bacterium]
MGAILLLGGRSTRMGTAKASLDWHGEPLAAHVARVLQRAAVGPVIVVAAPDQDVPALPDGVELVRDRVADQGPLRGIEAGLDALGDRADAAFVASVDAPLLHPTFVTALLGALTPDVELLVPDAQGFRHPLTAVWRTSTLPAVTAALADGVAGPGYLFDRVRTRFLDEAALLTLPGVASADPRLDSLRNANTPAELASVRERADAG